MEDSIRSCIFGAFAADSLALAAHWIYDQEEIEELFDRMEQLESPMPDSYHAPKTAGEFTHLGDQTLVLLESLAETGSFDVEEFFHQWRALFESYGGYVDSASRKTLESIAAGADFRSCGSDSSELAGAARIAPLAAVYGDDLEGFIAAARAQTAMTHKSGVVVDAAEFFARAAYAAIHGAEALEALEQAAEAEYADLQAKILMQRGTGFADISTMEAAAILGQNCSMPCAFPTVVQIIASHPGNLKDALIDNVMSGGDSASRGLLVGMIMGAKLGNIPESWTIGLKQHDHIAACLAKLGK
jgi:ADP-ribosylglycohydrolase